MSLPGRDRFGEIGVKAVHLALRQVAAAPEQRTARRLRSQASDSAGGPACGPRVLFLTPRDWAAHVHWDGVIAQALRARGADVRFGTCGGGLPICDRANTWEAPPMPCRSCRSYVHDSIDAHGFPRRALAEGWNLSDDWPELDALGLQEMWDVVYDDVPIGRLVEVPLKWFLMAADIDDDPLATVTLRRFLRSARRVVDGARSLLELEQPEVVVMTNGLFLFEAILRHLCEAEGIDVVTYERGLIKETLVFERNGVACLFDLDDEWERWRSVPLSADEEHELDSYLHARMVGDRTIDRFWKDVEFRAPRRDRPGLLVTAFSNLTWDSAVIGRSGAFDSIREWLVACVDVFADRPHDELLIRAHPAEVKLPGKQTREPVEDLLADRHPVLPPNVRIVGPHDPISSYSLMDEADAGLVFSSTTGLEMAVRGLPVVVAGNTHFAGKGLTVDPTDPADFVRKLDAVLADPGAHRPDPEIARRYAHLFFFRHPVRSDFVEEHVLGLARINVSDLAELAPGRHDGLDRICDLILQPDDRR